MTESKELRKLHKSTMVNDNGELIVNAGRFSRGAIIVAFEMMGGIDRFAEWAEDNPTDFYTKLFGKTVGREVENKNSDSVESLLAILDGEAEDVTPPAPPVQAAETEVLDAPRKKRNIAPSTRDRLNKIGEKYFTSEATFIAQTGE